MTDKMNCMLCGSISFERKGKIRTNRKILANKVLECSHCSLVFLNDDTHISEYHYEQSLMHDTVLDLAESRLETKVDDLRRLEMLESEIKDKNLVEIGSGNGGFLTLAKHLVKSAVGVEPEKKHHDNFNSENLKVYSSINEYANSINNSIDHRADVVVSFHVIEHVKNPLDFLLQILSLLKPNGKAFIETPNSNDALIKLYDSSAFQDFTYWDNHLVLFNKKSIEHMVEKISGVSFRSISVQRYGIANHLYWLANGKPGGHKKWNFLDNTLMNKQYQELLADQNMNDTLFYEFTKIYSECKVALE
jgi:2-polyprenyl-3-methyl-5-hydroxy-6-metoxy-1,4-benzoquinol methylase